MYIYKREDFHEVIGRAADDIASRLPPTKKVFKELGTPDCPCKIVVKQGKVNYKVSFELIGRFVHNFKVPLSQKDDLAFYISLVLYSILYLNGPLGRDEASIQEFEDCIKRDKPYLLRAIDAEIRIGSRCTVACIEAAIAAIAAGGASAIWQSINTGGSGDRI